jgi:hypothetical protein
VKAHSATLREFAFSMLVTAAGDAVTGAQVKQFWPFLKDGLENKDVNVVVACLKFLTVVTQSKEVCDVLVSFQVHLLFLVCFSHFFPAEKRWNFLAIPTYFFCYSEQQHFLPKKVTKNLGTSVEKRL